MKDRSVIITERGYAFLGEKLRDWSLNPESRPRTVKDFKEMVSNEYVLLGADFADGEKIHWLTPKPLSEELSFVLPAAEEMVAPLPEGLYRLPDFYRALAFRTEPRVAEADRTTFRLCRIADYAAGRCM